MFLETSYLAASPTIWRSLFPNVDGKYYSCNCDEGLHQCCYRLPGTDIVTPLQLRSEKTDRGEQKPGVHVVHPQWLWDCVSQWRRIPEAPYEAMLRAMFPGDSQPPAEMSHSVASPASQSSDPVDTNTGAASPSSSTPGPSTEGVAGPSSAPQCSSPTSSREIEGDELFVSDDKAFDTNGAGVDWAAVDEEVDAFLNESGDEDVDDYEGASDSSIRSDARWAI